MTKRDLRAILVLAAWGVCLAGYFGYSRFAASRAEWRAKQERLDFLLAATGRLDAQRRRDREAREKVELAFPKAWRLETPDHLRLKGEEGLLAAVEGAGLKNTRLESKGLQVAYGIRQFAWSLEGEGTLGQWVNAIHGMEGAQPFMSATGFELSLSSDAWHPEDGNPEGPALKGKVDCSWIVGP